MQVLKFRMSLMQTDFQKYNNLKHIISIGVITSDIMNLLYADIQIDTLNESSGIF